MGLFSKLKDFFSGKSIESLQEFEIELKKLQKKVNSEIIALIGTQGRLKGLPLVYTSIEEVNLRKYAALLTELVDPINQLSNEEKVKDFIIHYEESILFFKPIMNNISFFAIFPDKDNLPALEQWINTNSLNLRRLFHDEI
jgi:hypothetical protein